MRKFLFAPRPPGVCVLRSNLQEIHRSCQCTVPGNEVYKTFCKDQCQDDNDCKGYSYSLTQNTCDIYTDANDVGGTVKCPTVSNDITCLKRNDLLTGPITTRTTIGVEGCFIKETRKFL